MRKWPMAMCFGAAIILSAAGANATVVYTDSNVTIDRIAGTTTSLALAVGQLCLAR